MARSREASVSLRDLRFARGGEPVLAGVDLELFAGELALLAAPNGAGKSTLLSLAAGLLRPTGGEALVFEAPPSDSLAARARVGLLVEGAPLPLHWTGRRVLAFQRETFAPRWDQAECDRLLKALEVDLDLRVGALSRGQRTRLALAATLAPRPSVLLLDEPLVDLDVATRRMIVGEILDLVGEAGCAVLWASHEIAEAERIADRFVLLGGGRVRCDEPVVDLLERHRLLTWPAEVGPPPEALEVAELFELVGFRGLSQRWDEGLASEWLERGGAAGPADLETIYLALTGAVERA